MAVRPILIFPEAILSAPATLIEDFGPATDHLIQDLWDTLRHSPGVGLAAPQIGVPLRVSVIDTSSRLPSGKKSESSHGPLVLINPVRLDGKGVQIPREGCLSVPDFLANVQRMAEVTVRYQDESGEVRKLMATGFEALALQHEMDHLDGLLFLDRVANLKTDLFRRKKY